MLLDIIPPYHMLYHIHIWYDNEHDINNDIMFDIICNIIYDIIYDIICIIIKWYDIITTNLIQRGQ